MDNSTLGKCLGNGTLVTTDTQLSIITGMAFINGAYMGSVYLGGKYQGKSVTISTPLVAPSFTADDEALHCIAISNPYFRFAGVPAILEFEWSQKKGTFQTGTVAWTVKDTEGNILFASNGDGSPVALGQVIVKMPVAVIPLPA